MKPAFKNCVFDNSETATCSLEDDGYQLPVSGTSGRSPHRWMSIAHRSYSPDNLDTLTSTAAFKPNPIIFAVNWTLVLLNTSYSEFPPKISEFLKIPPKR